MVDTELGSRRVASVEFWTGFEGLLYNLETTEHVFRVGSLGSLVHNACDLPVLNADFSPKPSIKGKVGEFVAGVDGPKSKITVNGRNRYPDGITRDAIRESKNVRRLAFTRQLRDYRDYAKATGRRFELYVPEDAVLSRPLLDAEAMKVIIIIRMKGL
mgnify:FL=1